MCILPSKLRSQNKDIYIFSTLRDPYPCIYYSKLDCRNSVLSGLSKNQTQRLQYVQNSFARLLTGTSKHDDITPILRQLHWLPPQYVSELLSVTILEEHCAPRVTPKYELWNRPPDDIRSCNSVTVFKSKLKTFIKRYFI